MKATAAMLLVQPFFSGSFADCGSMVRGYFVLGLLRAELRATSPSPPVALTKMACSVRAWSCSLQSWTQDMGKGLGVSFS